MSSTALTKHRPTIVSPEHRAGVVSSASSAQSVTVSREQQLLGLQSKAGNQAVQLVLDEASLEKDLRNLPRLPHEHLVAVLRRFLTSIEHRISSGERRIQAQMALRAENFSNYLISGAIEVFGLTSLPSDDWNDAWNLINRGRDQIQRGEIKEALETLVSASKATTAHWELLNDYLESTDKGADRSVFTLQVLQAAGALAATAWTGGATAVVVGASYGATQNLAGQTTSVLIGIQGKIDWSGMAFDTLFGVLTGAAGGRLRDAVLKRLMARPEVASLGRHVISEVVSDLVSGRLSSILHTVGRGLFDKLRGKEQLTVDQFIERLADQLKDPKGMFIDAIMGRAAKIVHSKKSLGSKEQVSTKSPMNDQTTVKQRASLSADTHPSQSKKPATELREPVAINRSSRPNAGYKETESARVNAETMRPPVKNTLGRNANPEAELMLPRIPSLQQETTGMPTAVLKDIGARPMEPPGVAAKPDIGLAERGYRPVVGERSTTKEQYKREQSARRWAEKAIDKAFATGEPEVPKVKGGKTPRIGEKKIPVSDPIARENPANFLDIGTLPAHAGETQIQALARIRSIIGRKVSDIPSLDKHWNDARASVLKKYKLTNDNYVELYEKTREAFWRRVRNDPAAAKILSDAGFGLPGGATAAPVLAGVAPSIPVEDTRISLDHVAEKAQGANWKKALDADNLRMEFARPNTEREIKQMRFPELR